VEFFLSLFPGKKKSKRALLASLKSLQSALGGANDIAVRTGLKEEIITEKKSRATALKLQHRAFAAGLIIGHQQAKIEPTIKQAERAYKDCLDTKPFWIQGEAKKLPSSSGERSTTLVAPASAPAD
jgi:CHAD domain-containing protein